VSVECGTDLKPKQTSEIFMNQLRVALAGFLFAFNTVLHVPPLLIVALLKALLPLAVLRVRFNHALEAIAASWIACNSWLIRRLTHTRMVVDVAATLSPHGHYLVIANHQSWVDIPVLQAVLSRRIPLLRFFLKSQLFWVPLLGLAWWALDFPFMKRYSRAQLTRRPELAGRDIEATRRACAKFKNLPIAIMNFVEGTRFSPAKQRVQASPFAHLLKPKAGGVAFVLDAMGSALHAVLDVTIVYPAARPSFADLFADRIPAIHVRVVEHPIPADLLAGNYAQDPANRERVQSWINQLWLEKDAAIANTLANAGVVSEQARAA
jgi:1-acyl-sn-glycerol-3-phosphate acyltransferase